MMSESLQFAGPFMSFDAKAPYIDALNRLGPILQRNEIREIICNGADNCVLYNLVAVNNAGSVPCLEWITIAEGKITEIKLLFDKEIFIRARAAALNGNSL